MPNHPFLTGPRANLSSALLLVMIASGPIAVAQDVEEVFILRTQFFDQSSAYIATLDPEGDSGFEAGPVSFGVFAVAPGPDLIEGGTFTAPGSLAVPLVEDGDGGEEEEWFFNESFEFLSQLDDSYGLGNYVVNLDTLNDGLLAFPIELSSADYLSVTTFSNFEDAQTINPAQEFVLKWNKIDNGTAEDELGLDIRNENGDTVYYSDDFDFELTGLSTQVTIPEDTLESGKNYFAYLESYRISGAESGGTFTGSAESKVLRMPLQTTGIVFDDQNPTLEFSSPYWGQEDVQRDAAVVFKFDEPMDTGGSVSDAISWTGIDPGMMTYTWTPTGDILYCHYQALLPATTQVDWSINAVGSLAMLHDEADNPLEFTQGNFTTTAGDPAGGSGIAEVLIGKIHAFFQDGDTPTELHYASELYVDLDRAGAVTSADLEIPGRGTALNLGTFAEDYGDFRELEAGATYAEASDLGLIFPGGDYKVTLHGVSEAAPIEVSLSFGSEDDYPNAPTIQGLTSLENVDPDQPITLTWDAMVGGNENDVIIVEIGGEDACYFESPDLGEAGSLDGTATSVTIPAGILPPGRSLEAELVFIKTVDQDESHSFDTFAVFASVTIFEMQTTGDPEVPLTLTIARTGGNIALMVEGEVGFTYVVEASESLSNNPDSWSDLSYEFIPDDCAGFMGSFEFIDEEAGEYRKRFYRVNQMPNE